MRLMLMAVILAIGCNRSVPTTANVPPKGDPPKAGATDFPPADWTHKELAEHLATKGVTVEVRPIPIMSAPDQPAAWFNGGKPGGGVPMIAVFLCTNERVAREKAGTLGEGAFHCGRFALGVIGSAVDRDYTDNRALLAKIATALK
jgi:hypothetical protein